MKSLITTIVENYLSASLGITVNEEEDPLKKYYEKYGEKWKEVHDLDDEIKPLLEPTKKTSNIALDTLWVVDDDKPYHIAKLYGGLNGSGNWRNYLKDIQKIISHFDEQGTDNTRVAYIIKLDVDVPDDVWTLYLGIHK